MRTITILLVINLAVLLGLATYVFYQPKPIRKAYVLNQKVFGEFKGTLQLEKKLGDLKKQHARYLDSMKVYMPGNATLLATYEEASRRYALEEQELSEKYTADLWKEINQHVVSFGKEKEYDFIFGAIGDGSLMFANEAHDVTADVITYINNRYEGE